jgi:glycerate 2-kinase
MKFEPGNFLKEAFLAGVRAADPRAATRQAVMEIAPLDSPVWVIAIGKGAHGMASGAVEALRVRNAPVAGGLVVANALDASASHGLESYLGDHPTPGPDSFAAADRLAEVAAQTTAETDAIVLVSGGATSLVAAPLEPISERELQDTFKALLGSGADIGLMNAVRKRVLRFGAGRLALALGTRRIHCLVASDVIGNDLASIASGPCVPDHGSARETQVRLRAAGADGVLPAAVRELLVDMAEGRVPDVPSADHPRFASTEARVILDRTNAEQGVAAFARDHGVSAEVLPLPMSGEASQAARNFVAALHRRPDHERGCIIWSGETTVTLGGADGSGGRCQEFALASAMELERSGMKDLAILAAGTDGRDGPTDAAGAIVDSTTPSRIRARGIDPDRALREHNSFDALQAADALLNTGPTGTNVNDLMIALSA